jgi:uncharacterized protein
MRVWVDITDSSHVLFFAPVARRLEDAGHTVTLTARRFASSELMLRRLGLGAVLTGQHRGGDLGTRAIGLVNRTAQLLGSASSGRFDVAVGSHATDFVLTAWALGVPQLTLLDAERLGRGNTLNLRLVDRIAVPDVVPVGALTASGASAGRLLRFPGFKEEYYLRDVEPDPEILDDLGVDARTVVGVIRPPSDEQDTLFDARWRPERSLPGSTGGADQDGMAHELEAFVRELARRRNLTLILVARDEEQRERFLGLRLPNLIVPQPPVDGVSLVAAADFTLGGGGVMGREAIALGTPAYTLSRSAPSAIDARLLADGRLRRAHQPADITLRKKDVRTAPFAARDPRLFVDEIVRLGTMGRAQGRFERLL